MKRTKWQIILGFSLIFISFLLYLLHYAVFRDAKHILIYLMGDIAFVPIEVLLVTLIIDRLLNMREKRAMLEKMNMVIGTFFSEVGTELLVYFSDFDLDPDKLRKDLIVTGDWSEKQFAGTEKLVRKYEYAVDSQKGDLGKLKVFLAARKSFLLQLLENQNLLEHERFTDLLWAVFHLTEELSFRRDLLTLPDNDYKHLSGDIRRAYSLLIYEWLEYMKHLKNNYPYLFSLAVRTNPFDINASPEVK